MAATTRNISTLIESQLPGFIIEDYAQMKTFIESYYEQQELRGQPLDIIHNITKYRNIDFYSKNILKEKTTLASNISSNDTTISVDDATSFPETNGYIKIHDEILFYKKRTNTEFLEVSRGVSGNNTLGDLYNKSEFVSTEASPHGIGDDVLNISNLFLYAFVRNFENDYLAAFPEKFLKGEIDKRTLIKNIGDFYRTKGTERSIRFLFTTIISRNPNEKVSVYAPKDYTLKASTSDWVSKYAVNVNVISGNIKDLIGYRIEQGPNSAVVDNVEGNSLILAPETIIGEFEIASKTRLRRQFPSTFSKGDKITVFSTQGFPQEGKLFIGGKEVTYRKKSINQFTIDTRESSNATYNVNTDVYSGNPVVSGNIKFFIEGVVFNLLPSNPQPYASTGDEIEVSKGGFDTTSPIIKNIFNDVRWFLNTSYTEPNSIHANININQAISDVSAVFEDDQYFYICSSSFPSHSDLLNPAVTVDLQDQELLKLIRKQPITTTEVYETGNKDVGILIDGSPVYSIRSEEEVIFGNIESIDVVSKGKNYELPPVVLINEEPNKATAILAGETISGIKIEDDTVYNSDPTVRITSGEGAKLTAIVTNGEITSIAINDPGQYYTSSPTIVITDVTGRGSFAEYEAIVSNGKIIDLVKINGGKLYDARFTSVVAVPVGDGAKAIAKVKRWVKDRYRLLKSSLDTNNSYVFKSSSGKGYGYGVVSNPVVLRRRLLDSITSGYDETTVLQHSPILGYAYDGNPIYGPYGYSNPLRPGSVSRMKSGYVLKSARPNGPSLITNPLGTFIDDYEWIPSVNSEKTELDINNGRFCVTPDYPEGVYAYFVTIDANNNPVFPYVLGTNFYSIPVDSNYNSPITQKDLPKEVKRLDVIDFELSGRGVKGKVKDVTPGIVKSASVVSSVDTFEVGSKLLVQGNQVDAYVSSLKGKEVLSIESEQTKALEITTVNPVYLFAGNTISQGFEGFGEVVTNTFNNNNFILRNVVGDFDFTSTIDSNEEIQRFIVDVSSTYTKGSQVQLVDIDNESIVATGEVLESVISQNSVIVRVLTGQFVLGSNYYLKSNTLSDTSRSEIISITDLSKNIEVFSVNDSIAILETNEEHGISVGDVIEVDINPDISSTETTYFVRKKIYQNLKTVPVTHESFIVDTGIGSGDVLTTGSSYVSGTYEDVELVFRDSNLARNGVGILGDPNNARARVVIGNPNGNGLGPVLSVTITNKGAGYRKEDILVFSPESIIDIVENNPQQFAFAVDHVGFAADNDRLYLSNLKNLSNGDFIKIGEEIVEILGVNIAGSFVSVSRGRKGTIPTNHYNGASVVGEDIPFRISGGYEPLGSGSSQPTIKSYDEETGFAIITYDYSANINNITRVTGGTVFFDQSKPKKVVTLSNVEEASYKLELSKDDENNFEVNPSFDVQRYYSYKFNTSHFSMVNTFLDISPSINYNILVDGKEVSEISPGSVGSFTKIRFGFAPDVDPANNPERVDLRYSTFYYFIKAFGVDTGSAKINIIPDPLTGRKKITHKTPTKIVYDLDSTILYDGSGEISYTTTSLNAFGKIDKVDIRNSSRSLTTVPVVTGAYPKRDNQPIFSPVIEDGKLLAFNLERKGIGYSNPKLVLTGDGTGAKFRLITQNDTILGVVMESSGRGYTTATATVVETDANIYLESDNIGCPKNVEIIFYGTGFTDDYSTTPSFKGSTVLVLEDADLFKPTIEIVQPATGATASVDLQYWRTGSNLLKVKDVVGTFKVGESIESTINKTSAVVKHVLATDFLEDIKSYTQSGAFSSSKGATNSKDHKIQDSYFYQDYSYVVESETSIEDWRDLILETTHPAGFELFGEVNIFTDGEVLMPEASQKPVETHQQLSVSIQAIDSITTKRQITQTIALFHNSNIRRGLGAISVSDVDLSDTFFRDIRLEPAFDGDIDPDTGKRIGTTTFTMYQKGNNTFINPFNDQQILVTLDGILQEPGEAFTTVGNQIEFAEPPLGPRVAEGQAVAPQTFYGKSLRYVDDTLNTRYLRKFRDISDQFDNIKEDFDLYYDDGTPAKTEDNELLIVVIDGIKQIYGESYEIRRYEDPSTPDKIIFSSKPEVEDALYDSEDPREDSVLRNGQSCYIYSIGNYFTASINTNVIPNKPRGPFLIKNRLTNDVINVPDPLYAIVFVENVLQIPGKAYNIFGPQISFRSPLSYFIAEDGTYTYPEVEIIYVYGRSVEQSLTIHNFEPDTYLRDIEFTLSGDVLAGDEFSSWINNTRYQTIDSGVNSLYAEDIGEIETYEYSRQYTVTSNGTGYTNNKIYSFVPFYNLPTQTFEVTLDVTGDFLIDAALMPVLQLSPGNTYRFNVSDPSMVGQILTFNHVVDNGLIYQERVGVPGIDDYAFVDLIVLPEAVNDTGMIEYFNSTSVVTTGTVDIVTGPIGQYGYGYSAVRLSIGESGDVTVGNSYTEYGTGYKDGDVLVSNGFFGYDNNGNGDIVVSISIVYRDYQLAAGNEVLLGEVKNVKRSVYGEVIIQLKATKNWIGGELENKVYVFKKYFNNTKETFKYTIRGVNPTASIVEPTGNDGVSILRRNTSWWLKGSIDDNAYYKRTKVFSNLHPKDKIRIAGEESYREVKEISRFGKKTNFLPGANISKDHYVDIKTTLYNGEQSGQGLSVFAPIDGEGRVTELIWNRIVWNETYTKILDKTFTGYTFAPNLYFIPKTPAGGGAKAQVIFSGDIISIDLIDPGFGYEEPPTVVVAKPYNVIPDPNRKIDSLSVIKFDIKVNNSVVIVKTIVTIANSPISGLNVSLSYIILAVANPRAFQAITVKIPTEVAVVSIDTDLVNLDIESEIVSITEDVQSFDTKREEVVFKVLIQSESEEKASVVEEPTEVQLQYQRVTSDFFLRPTPQSSGKYAIVSADFLIGDTILYVTNTTGFPSSGNLLVNFERVTYISKEIDRFFISERGVNTIEANALIGDFVQAEPVFSIEVVQSDIDIIIEEPVDPEEEYFSFMGIPIGGIRQEVIARLEPGTLPVLVDLGDLRNDILGNQINGIIDLQLKPQIQPYNQLDVSWQIRRSLDVLERTDLNDSSITTETVETVVQPDVLPVPMSGATIIQVDQEIYLYPINLGIEEINVSIQSGGVIVVPGLYIPVQVIATFINNEFIPTTNPPSVSVVEGSVSAGYYEGLTYPLYIRWEDTRKAPFDIKSIWTRILEDDDVKISFDDFGGSIIRSEFEYFIRYRIWTNFDEAESRTVTVSLPQGYLEITQIPVRIDPVEEVIRFIAERTAPLNVDIYEWTRVIPYEKQFDSLVSINSEDEFISKVEVETDTQVVDITLSYDRIVPVWTGVDEELDVRVLDTVLHDDRRVIQPQVLIGSDFNVFLALRITENGSGLPIIKIIELTAMVCGGEDHQEGAEITLIINPVEQVLIEGVMTEVVGPSIVEIKEDAVVTQLQILTPSSFAGVTEFEYFRFPLLEIYSDTGIVTTFNQDTRVIEPLYFQDSVIFAISEIKLLGSKINGQELFIAFNPETPVQAEFEIFRYVNLWSGGAIERSGEFPVDELGIPFLALATPFQGDELSAKHDLLERVVQPQIFPGVQNVDQEFYKQYPNQHYDTVNRDQLSDEGLYANITMPNIVSVEVFFTETIPGGSDQEGLVDQQFIETRFVDIQTISLQITRNIDTIEIIPANDFNVQKQVTSKPAAFELFVSGGLSVTTNFDSVPLDERERPPVYTDITTVVAFEPQDVFIRLTRTIDNIEFDLQATIFQEYVRHIESGAESTYGTTENLELVDSITEVRYTVESEQQVTQPDSIEETLRIIQSIVTGIADELDSVYLRTTLGPTYKQYEANAFISNGSLNVNGSIAQTLANFQILEFEKGDTSTRPNGEPFNLAIPSINEIGGRLAGDLLSTELTSINISSAVPLDQMNWPSSGVILIGDTITGTLETIEYTGISGTSLIGITRGSNPQTHSAATSYVRTIG